MQRLHYLGSINGFSRFCFGICLLVTGLMIVSSSALASEGDTVRPFVTASMGYDSNLFRLADSAEALAVTGTTKIPSISYHSLGAGVDVDWKQGRQQVTARLSGNKTTYSQFSDLLDYTGREINADWKWKLGNRWYGNVSASQNRLLTAYNDTTNAVLANNIRTDNQQVIQANYWFHPGWRARIRIANVSSNYSAPSQKFRDNTTTNATAGLYRLGRAVESVGVEASTAEGSYDTSPNSDYNQKGIRLVGNWNYSGKLNLTGHVGYVQRNRPRITTRNYSGTELKLKATWTLSGKTQVEASAYRDLRAFDTVLSSNQEADGLSVSGAMLVAPKTRLNTQLSREDIGFKGDNRSDKVTNLSVSVSYEAWRGGDISAGFQHSNRTSNSNNEKYDSNSVFVQAVLKF